MYPVLSFRDVSLTGFLEGFSCDIEAGCSALFVTSREDESTALTRLITGLARPSSGTIQVDGHDISGLGMADLHALRQRIGVVQSSGGLVSNLKVWENITLPLMYHSGGVTPDEEKIALDYLARLGYAGNVMALPAHLTPHERRVTAMVRTIVRQPRIVLYSDCIDASPSPSRTAFLQVAREFHEAVTDRTSLYLTSSPALASDLPVDMIVRIHDSAETVSRNI